MDSGTEAESSIEPRYAVSGLVAVPSRQFTGRELRAREIEMRTILLAAAVAAATALCGCGGSGAASKTAPHSSSTATTSTPTLCGNPSQCSTQTSGQLMSGVTISDSSDVQAVLDALHQKYNAQLHSVDQETGFALDQSQCAPVGSLGQFPANDYLCAGIVESTSDGQDSYALPTLFNVRSDGTVDAVGSPARTQRLPAATRPIGAWSNRRRSRLLPRPPLRLPPRPPPARVRSPAARSTTHRLPRATRSTTPTTPRQALLARPRVLLHSRPAWRLSLRAGQLMQLQTAGVAPTRPTRRRTRNAQTQTARVKWTSTPMVAASRARFRDRRLLGEPRFGLRTRTGRGRYSTSSHGMPMKASSPRSRPILFSCTCAIQSPVTGCPAAWSSSCPYPLRRSSRLSRNWRSPSM